MEGNSPRPALEGTSTTRCFVPLLALQVFANGDVYFCHRCDYNATREFAPGNVREPSRVVGG
jgi:hypothetical protein